MELKKLRLKRWCFAAIIILAIVLIFDLIELYQTLINAVQNIEQPSYIAYPVNVVLGQGTQTGNVWGTVFEEALSLVMKVSIGIVLLRILRSDIIFSDKNRKNLKWYGIFTAAQAVFLFAKSAADFVSILTLFIACSAAVIWFFWPMSAEESENNNILLNRKKTGNYHMFFIVLQVVIFSDCAWYYFVSFWMSNFPINIFWIGVHPIITYYAVLDIIRVCISIFYYNRIGQVFWSVSRGVSKFDAGNVQRIKTAALINVIGMGIVMVLLFLSGIIWMPLISARDVFEWLEWCVSIIATMFVPVAVLCLALAYEYGAKARPQPQNAEVIMI